MNQPRRLLLVPLALLGAALLVRARLPRPITDSDKWLWEQGETVTSVDVSLSMLALNQPQRQPHIGLHCYENLILTDREAIRSLLRSFKQTGTFKRVQWSNDIDSGGLILIGINHARLSDTESLIVVEQPHGYILSRPYQEMTAPLKLQSVEGFLQVFRSAAAQARRKQPGYRMAKSVAC